jgi:molybdenum cofactor cytidylyltransferase
MRPWGDYRNYVGKMPVESVAMKRTGYSLGVVILAAGRSSRMGQPKLLLPWGESSILGHLNQRWQVLGAKQITVVCSPNDRGIQTELNRLNFPEPSRVVNPDPERGMFSSIQCAAGWHGWQRALTHWAIVLGDQPHLSLETLGAIIDFSAANFGKVCQPRKGGHRYHPVVLPKKVFEQLRSSSAANLKEFLESCETGYCEMTDAGLELDIDRPEDYQKALEVWKQSSEPKV